MSLAQEENLCCGCTACESVCPLREGKSPALRMKVNDKGFLYPVIDKNVCISCHACEQVCFYQTGMVKISDHLTKIIAYAVKAKEERMRQESQSGGAFGVIAQQVLAQGGIVYGVAYDETFHVKHRRISEEKELIFLHGSKYVQSDLRKVYIQVKQDLKNNKKVLFSGTPCQVMGIRKFLKRPYENLLTVDIICYGVPSPQIWRNFLSVLQRKSYGNLRKVEHRAKDFGWHECHTRLTYERKTLVTDGWTRMWSSALPLRSSCYSCKFTNTNRPGDFTVGDCWGVEKCLPDFDDNKGVSLLLINTEKGQRFFKDCQDKFIVHSITLEDYLQPRLVSPTQRPTETDVFWKNYKQMSTKDFIQQYAGLSWKQKLRQRLAQCSWLRRLYHNVRV